MDDRDVELRNRIYRWFVEHGRAPSAEEAGTDEAGLRRLHEAHARSEEHTSELQSRI